MRFDVLIRTADGKGEEKESHYATIGKDNSRFRNPISRFTSLDFISFQQTHDHAQPAPQKPNPKSKADPETTGSVKTTKPSFRHKILCN